VESKIASAKALGLSGKEAAKISRNNELENGGEIARRSGLNKGQALGWGKGWKRIGSDKRLALVTGRSLAKK